VLAETVASSKGIGTVIMIAGGNFDVPMVFAGLLLLAADWCGAITIPLQRLTRQGVDSPAH